MWLVVSAGGDAAGARGGRGGGYLGERPVVPDPVADNLRQAVGQDVQVGLAGADGFVERVRGWVVLDQRAAEGGEGAVRCDGVAANRAAARVRGVGEAPGGGQPAGRGLVDGRRWAVRGQRAVTGYVVGGGTALSGRERGVGNEQVTGAVKVEPERAA